MKSYKSVRPFISEDQKNQFAKNQFFVEKDGKVYVQGRLRTIKVEDLNSFISMGVLEEKEITDEFAYEYIILNDEYKVVKDVLSKAKKELPQYEKIFETIKRWVFVPKGSSASKIQHEIEFQNNPEDVLKNTILREGNKAKPGDVHMNRGTERHGPYVTEEQKEIWINDDTTILPYGIRQSDYASQSEQVKIFVKVIGQVCSMEDCPQDFRDFFNSELGIVPDVEPFRDYLRLINRQTRKDMGYPKLYFSDFEKNQHHSKENGLEFCHIDPSMDFPTNVDNITIGSSRANRLQGGYPLWYLKETFK